MYRVCTEILIFRRHYVFGHSVLHLPDKRLAPRVRTYELESRHTIGVSSRWRKFEKDGEEDEIGEEGTEVLRTLNVAWGWHRVERGVLNTWVD